MTDTKMSRGTSSGLARRASGRCTRNGNSPERNSAASTSSRPAAGLGTSNDSAVSLPSARITTSWMARRAPRFTFTTMPLAGAVNCTVGKVLS